jgi:hypothetical protein
MAFTALQAMAIARAMNLNDTSKPMVPEFSRIKRLPPYVFNITNELKMAARRAGEDVIDLSMGNPDGPTPRHIVDKLVEVAQREDTHGYSVSKGFRAFAAPFASGTSAAGTSTSTWTARRSSPSAPRRASRT